MNIFKPLYLPPIKKLVYLNEKTFENTASNLEKMAGGFAPIGIDGKKVTLHHLNRRHSAPLVMLTATNHQKYNKVIHSLNPPVYDKVNRSLFNKERKVIWQWFYNFFSNI